MGYHSNKYTMFYLKMLNFMKNKKNATIQQDFFINMAFS